ncbi:MAG: aldose epimerase family protein [Flavobacteriaceae bacterium]
MNFKNLEFPINGKTTRIFTLENKNGLKAIFSNYGQRIISLHVPDKRGNFEDIVLGFSSLPEYFDGPGKYFGAVIGRYGNRISKGKFTLDGTAHQLSINNGDNHLHGGKKGFGSVVWDTEQVNKSEIHFSRVSPDNEEGYSGNLLVEVTYQLNDANELIIKYKAKTDKATPINLTHHSYFNLKGAGNGSIDQHILQINANSFTPVNQHLIPTGTIEDVQGTPFDFLIPKPIGRDISTKNEQLYFGNGYDHNFVLNKSTEGDDELTFAAKAVEANSGRTMEVFTNEPGIQFYSGNRLDILGKEGKHYPNRGAFCLETQHYPNSPNNPNFPNVILQPGEVYKSTCMYRFGVQTDKA